MSRVIDITYKCLSCGFEAPDNYKSMICKCGGDMRGTGPSITGTMDSFGIGRKFYHTDENGTREITNFKEWERAGYRDAISDTKNKDVAKMAKDKMKRIKNNGGKSLL